MSDPAAWPDPTDSPQRALVRAVLFSDPAAVARALARGASPHRSGPDGDPLLAYASDPAVARLLLDAGADPLAPDRIGLHALDYARGAHDAALAALLEKHAIGATVPPSTMPSKARARL